MIFSYDFAYRFAILIDRITWKVNSIRPENTSPALIQLHLFKQTINRYKVTITVDKVIGFRKHACKLSLESLQGVRKYLPPGGRGTAKRWMRIGDGCRNICTSREQIMSQFCAFIRTALVIGRFRRSSSVTRIGSEVPIRATASPPGEAIGRCAQQLDKHQFRLSA